MKKFKKIMALVIAMAMVLGMMSLSAFGADGDFTGTAETTIEATNVTEGDSVEYFQLVEWDSTTSDWKLTTLGQSCGVTLANLVDGITEAEASTIAGNVTGTGTAMTAGTPATTFTATVNAGLYYLRAIPADTNKDTVYNPAFVSADYYEGGNTVDFSSAYESSTVVKKSDVPFDKVVNDTTPTKYTDVKPGDVVPFKVTTTIPAFGSSFTNPKFEITDALSAGLELEGDVSVKYGETTVTASNSDVTITPKADKSGYTVAFTKEYLTGLNGATPAVEITYSAKVTTDGSNNVTYMDNEATLTFSNTPTTNVDKEKKTRHYTFAIDGDILGQTGKEGSELIKTGTDADGNILTENKKTYHDTEVSILSGATFKLVGTGDLAGVEKTAQSDANGRINFDGLDAGTYTLTEETAPTGFIKDTRTFTVTITPTYNRDNADYEGDEPDLLVSYEITITSPAVGDTPAYNGGATFTMTNDGGVTTTSTIESNSNFINNTQGKGLPSTGGIGTTIFYIVGAILVLGAGVVMVTRRRMDA